MLRKATMRCVTLLGVLLILLAGCASLIPTPDPVTITFAYPERDQGYYEQLVQQFQEENGYITVELKQMTRSFAQTIANDVFIAEQLSLPQLLEQGSIFNVTPFIEQDEAFNVADFYPGTVNVFRHEGKIWGVPADMNMMLMYYNQDLFDRYGATYPQIGWTWDQFLDAAVQTTDPTDDVYGYAAQYDDAFGIIEPILFIYQHGGRLFDNWQNPQMTTFDDPLNIEAMQWYAALIHDYGVAPTKEAGPDRVRYYPGGGIIEGKYAMWMGMVSDHGGKTWGREWPMHWGVVPLPRDQAATTMAILNGIFISSDTEHPDEAWMWVAFLSQQMPTASMPARRSLAESNAYTQMVGGDVATTSRAAVENTLLINPELPSYEKELGALMEAFMAIRSGDVTPDIALEEAQRKAGF